MRRLSAWARGTAPLFAAAVLGPAGPASAQDAAFQAFFFTACVNPVGELATRCGETNGGLGNLSGDSESSLNPNQVVSALESTLNRAQEMARGVQGLLEARRGDDLAAEEAARARHFTERLSAIAAGRGRWFDRDTSERERGFDGTSAGFQVGADYRLGEAIVVGGFFTYDRLDSDFDPDLPGVNFTPFSHDGSRDAQSYILTVFGSYNLTEALWVDGFVGGGLIDFNLRRDAVFQESNREVPQTDVRTSGDADGDELSVGVGTGYDLAWKGASFGGYARTRYIRTFMEGFTEDGGNGLAMSFPDQTRESLVTILGVRASYALSTSFGVVLPQVRGEWEHEFLRDTLGTGALYPLDLDRNVFGMRTDGPDRDYFNVAAGLAVVLPHGWIPYAEWQGLFGFRNWTGNRVVGGLRKEFH